MKKRTKIIIASCCVLVLLAFALYFFYSSSRMEDITWGVNFSQMQAEALGLDWKKTYLATLNDLGVRHIKLLPQWDWVEGKEGRYYFADIDWQVKQAQAVDASIIYVLGMKSGRWPECHVPGWATGLQKEEQQEKVLDYIRVVVNRYKNSSAITAWQAENEPLHAFGQCPWYDGEFLKKEVALIKSLDPTRPVIVSDTGEYSTWFRAASIGDVVGITTYRRVWINLAGDWGFYGHLLFPAKYYWLRSQIVKMVFGKQVIGVELQAEPWAPKPIYDISLAEQAKSMNPKQFEKNVSYARRMGLDTHYFWGNEWWYWLKDKKNETGMWDAAKKVFSSSKK